MKLAQIKQVLGGDIGTGNTKMPSTTFGLSTHHCQVGCKLMEVEGSVCSGCYARRLENFRPSVRKGWGNRTEMVHEATKSAAGMAVWVSAFTIRLLARCDGYHRWHDSGDLQSIEHLDMIVEVCKNTPDIKHWLPTKEKGIVSKFIADGGTFPDNLSIRLSMPMVDMLPTDSLVNTSTVHKNHKPIGYECPARSQGNACLDCRACWDKSVSNVSYPKH